MFFSSMGSSVLLSLLNNRSDKNCNVGSPAAVNKADFFHSDTAEASQTRATEQILPIYTEYACRCSL